MLGMVTSFAMPIHGSVDDVESVSCLSVDAYSKKEIDSTCLDAVL